MIDGTELQTQFLEKMCLILNATDNRDEDTIKAMVLAGIHYGFKAGVALASSKLESHLLLQKLNREKGSTNGS